MGCEENQFSFVMVMCRRGKEEAKREREGGIFIFGALTSVNVLAEAE